jgi:hypothetical protein
MTPAPKRAGELRLENFCDIFAPWARSGVAAIPAAQFNNLVSGDHR